jgi:hypothetical protein
MKKVTNPLKKSKSPPHESIEEEDDLEKAHHFEYQGHDDEPIGENILPHEDKGYGK